jgi:hypothetical protein
MCEKRRYRRNDEFKSAILRSGFNLQSAANILNMPLKAMHERLQRTKSVVFQELGDEVRNSKQIFSDAAIEELLASRPEADLEAYRNLRRALKSQIKAIAGSRRAQIEAAVGRALAIPPEKAFDKLSQLWCKRTLARLIELDACRREQKAWEACRKKRAKLKLLRPAA